MDSSHGLSEQQVQTLINNYKKKREREKKYYHEVLAKNPEYVKKNRDGANTHYHYNKEKKKAQYEKDKEFLRARQLFYHYRKYEMLDKFEEKHPQKVELLRQRGTM